MDILCKFYLEIIIKIDRWLQFRQLIWTHLQRPALTRSLMVAPLVTVRKVSNSIETSVIRLGLGPRVKRASPLQRALLSALSQANQAFLQDLPPKTL